MAVDAMALRAVEHKQVLPELELFGSAGYRRGNAGAVVEVVAFLVRHVTRDGAYGAESEAHLVRIDCPYRVCAERPAPRRHVRSRNALAHAPHMVVVAREVRYPLIEVRGMRQRLARIGALSEALLGVQALAFVEQGRPLGPDVLRTRILLCVRIVVGADLHHQRHVWIV